MDEFKQYFYKYTVSYYEVVDDNRELRTVSGLAFGSTFNDVCTKITNYFGEDTIEDLKIEFVSDCGVLEEDDLSDLFNISSNTKG